MSLQSRNTTGYSLQKPADFETVFLVWTHETARLERPPLGGLSSRRVLSDQPDKLLAMSTPYRIDHDDLDFVFFDQFGVLEALKGSEQHAELDEDICRATLREAARYAVEVLAPLNAVGDQHGCRLDDDGNVTTPPGFRDAWIQCVDGGWVAPDAPLEFEGVGLPHSLALLTQEMMIGANPAFMMYGGLSRGAAAMVQAFGDSSYRDMVATKLYSGEWGGTMCLTESGAGSSVGDNRAKAVLGDEPGVFLLEGEKIFISGGDQDFTENVIHLVLARTPGSPPGTKGLSLFLVPKFEFDDAGALGARNGIKVVGIEHKMGINGSATCTLAMGADRPCKGWLIGQEREGIAQMFKMMNDARIMVALQGSSACAAAYGFALQWANERVQGQPLDRRSPDSVTIVNHPDVRRMLMTLKVIAETTRSALMRLSFEHDVLETGVDEAQKAELQGRADLLIPVLKAHCTDLAFEMASMAVQVYGGYGFIREYPVEQLVRDTRIQAIYEGTNGIQAMDLLGRKMRVNDGALFRRWLEGTQSSIVEASKLGLAGPAEALGKAATTLAHSAMHLAKTAGSGQISDAFLYAVPFLKAFGGIVLGMEALDQAMVAKRKLDAGSDSKLLKGKLLNLEFYVAHLLPPAVAQCKTVVSSDTSCLDESLFRLD